MKLEQQVCSLELSKKLKKLNIYQGSLWYWILSCRGKDKYYLSTTIQEFKKPLAPYEYSAFTVAELGELLPEKRYDDDMWKQIWEREEKGFSEADARAKTLIRLLEQGIIITNQS